MRCHLPAAAMFGDTLALHNAAIAVAAQVGGNGILGHLMAGMQHAAGQGIGEAQDFGGALGMALAAAGQIPAGVVYLSQVGTPW